MALLDTAQKRRENAQDLTGWFLAPPCSILQDRQEQCSFKVCSIRWLDWWCFTTVYQPKHTYSFWSSLHSCVSLFVPLPASLPLSLFCNWFCCSPLEAVMWGTFVLPHSPHPHLSASHVYLLWARVLYAQIILTGSTFSLFHQTPSLASRSPGSVVFVSLFSALCPLDVMLLCSLSPRTQASEWRSGVGFLEYEVGWREARGRGGGILMSTKEPCLLRGN